VVLLSGRLGQPSRHGQSARDVSSRPISPQPQSASFEQLRSSFGFADGALDATAEDTAETLAAGAEEVGARGAAEAVAAVTVDVGRALVDVGSGPSLPGGVSVALHATKQTAANAHIEVGAMRGAYRGAAGAPRIYPASRLYGLYASKEKRQFCRAST
jgi:hypothetical protein